MRSTQGQVNRYAPEPIPADQKELARYLQNELQKLQYVIAALADGQIDVTTVAPTKPRDGMVRRSGATGWNPGAGQGVYCFYNSTWNRLG